MHGRLKVKSSEQQKLEKKIEREKKSRAYLEAIRDIFDNRGKQGDHPEEGEILLKKTAMMLYGNPDITTLWNMRKEITEERIGENEDGKEDQRLVKELEVTQQCLMANPKSYGAWCKMRERTGVQRTWLISNCLSDHRCWCMLRMGKPDWNRELSLCTRYLSLDERNFHCWDYRRFVAERAGVEPAKELGYSMELINTNFSNYSSWHYRSKLLPLVFPSDSGLGISEEKRREELDLIQNAAFTDPEDSSAWFYHTWLLGQGEKEELKVFLFRILPSQKAVLVTSEPISGKDIKIKINEIVASPVWTSPCPDSGLRQKLWRCELPDAKLDPGNRVSVSVNDKVEVGVLLDENCCGETLVAADSFCPLRRESDPATLEVLEQDLQNCRDLLDLEPDSKWTRLSMILVMISIDEGRYIEEILSSLERLSKVDSTRENFFYDLRSKFVMRSSTSPSLPKGRLDLSGKGLTSLQCPERLCLVKGLDLSGNSVRSLSSVIPFLVNCEELNCDGNEDVSLGQMEMFQTLPGLKRVSIRNTGLAKNITVISEIKEKCPNVDFVLE